MLRVCQGPRHRIRGARGWSTTPGVMCWLHCWTNFSRKASSCGLLPATTPRNSGVGSADSGWSLRSRPAQPRRRDVVCGTPRFDAPDAVIARSPPDQVTCAPSMVSIAFSPYRAVFELLSPCDQMGCCISHSDNSYFPFFREIKWPQKCIDSARSTLTMTSPSR